MVLDNIPAYQTDNYVVEGEYKLDFSIRSKEDVKITFTGTFGEKDYLIYPDDYSVSSRIDGIYVTLAPTYLPPEDSGELYIYRYHEINQPLSIVPGKEIPRKPLEWFLDKMVYEFQRLRRGVQNLIKLEGVDGTIELSPVEGRRDKLFVFDEDAMPTEVDPPDQYHPAEFMMETLAQIETRDEFVKRMRLDEYSGIKSYLSGVLIMSLYHSAPEMTLVEGLSNEQYCSCGIPDGLHGLEYVEFKKGATYAELLVARVATDFTYTVSYFDLGFILPTRFSASAFRRYHDGKIYLLEGDGKLIIYDVENETVSLQFAKEGSMSPGFGGICQSIVDGEELTLLIASDKYSDSQTDGDSNVWRTTDLYSELSDYYSWEPDPYRNQFEGDLVRNCIDTSGLENQRRFMAAGREFTWRSDNGVEWEKYGTFYFKNNARPFIGYSEKYKAFISFSWYNYRNEANANFIVYQHEKSYNGIEWEPMGDDHLFEIGYSYDFTDYSYLLSQTENCVFELADAWVISHVSDAYMYTFEGGVIPLPSGYRPMVIYEKDYVMEKRVGNLHIGLEL